MSLDYIMLISVRLYTSLLFPKFFSYFSAIFDQLVQIPH